MVTPLKERRLPGQAGVKGRRKARRLLLNSLLKRVGVLQAGVQALPKGLPPRAAASRRVAVPRAGVVMIGSRAAPPPMSHNWASWVSHGDFRKFSIFYVRI